jgi:hypothetical protein
LHKAVLATLSCLGAPAAYFDGVADPDRDGLISLCEQVLSAEITLDDLQRAWPDPVENPSLARLREALEDGIEHTPGYWFRPGVNKRRWQKTPEYGDIGFYLQRLREATN